MRDGRPLRFLGGALGGWTMFRIAALWPAAETASLQAFGHMIVPAVTAIGLPAAASMPPTMQPAEDARPAMAARGPEFVPRAPLRTISDDARSIPHLTPGTAPWPPQGALGPPLRPTPLAHGASRLAGSAWLLARGGPSGTLSGGQLGASQAGVRLTYALDHARRIAIAARIATPLSGRGKEAAIGIDWKPTRLPFHLIAEQRFVLDGGKGGPTIGIIGGYGPGMVAPGIRIEAYGQAGAIVRNGIEEFVDAAARMTHPVVQHGPIRVDVGAGVWGSAQKGASRFDVGPTVGVVIPIGKRAIRMAADWRERVAGDARPGSGPAFTIGSDF